jgi:hypothetical protein
MGRTAAEQETTFRWDEEERLCWAGTTTPRVAERWTRAGYPVVVIGKERDGTPCSWEVKLPWTGVKRPWMRLVSLGISHWNVPGMPLAPSVGEDSAEDDPDDGDGV